MEEKRLEGIPPYRVQALMKTAADISERLVAGRFLFNPTYEECNIVIDLVGEALEKCKKTNEHF